MRPETRSYSAVSALAALLIVCSGCTEQIGEVLTETNLNIPLVEADSATTADDAMELAAGRRDPGTGLCGSVIHFKKRPRPLSQLSDAIDLLDKPVGDPDILARKTALFTNINFRNADSTSAGDFTSPSNSDDLFPFSLGGMAMPAGDDRNIAMRLRGYLNVTDIHGGKPVTFGVHCDDACSLKIGGTMVIPRADERISATVTKQIIFKAPGLYPVELVYYQNSTRAVLEWSRAPGPQPEGELGHPLDTKIYELIPGTELYSATVGTNATCQECSGSAPPCSIGSFCKDGLCQSCNAPDSCGWACQVCPAGARRCVAGKCV